MPKARKDHKCCECGDIIKKGDIYEYVSGKWEGEFDTYKTCMICSRIRKDYCAPFGWLRDDLWDCLGVDYITGKIAEHYDDE
jgi:hypothetical protein